MKRALIAAAALLAALATTASAQGSVKDGSQWTDGKGNVVTAQVSDRDDGKVDVTFIDATGFTQPVTGTRGQGQTPSATSSPIATIWQGENKYRVFDPSTITPCLVQGKRGDGNWVNYKPVKKKTAKRPRFRSIATPFNGQQGSSMPQGLPPKPL